MKHLRRLLVVLFLNLGIAVSVCAQEAVQLTEYQVKAAFLYSLTSFVEWPVDAFFEHNQPLVVAVVGQNPFDSLLEQTIQGREVNGRRIEVRRIDSLVGIDEIHVLFVSKSEMKRVNDIVSLTTGHPILTVADMDMSSCKGIMVVLSIGNDNKLRFAINNSIVEKADLIISSRVLRLADLIRD